jgi:hypothetical protein
VVSRTLTVANGTIEVRTLTLIEKAVNDKTNESEKFAEPLWRQVPKKSTEETENATALNLAFNKFLNLQDRYSCSRKVTFAQSHVRRASFFSS